MPEMSQEHEQLAIHLLEQQFNEKCSFMWFQQKMLKQNPDYVAVEQQIQCWEESILRCLFLVLQNGIFTKRQQRQAEADALLELYPNDVLMSYLTNQVSLKSAG